MSKIQLGIAGATGYGGQELLRLALRHDDVDIAVAMQAWINALATAGKGVTWQLATALPALLRALRGALARRQPALFEVRRRAHKF